MKNNILIRVILSVLLGLELFAIFLISHIVYNGVIKVEIYVVIIITLIMFNMQLWTKMKQRGWLIGNIALQVILLTILPIIFWSFRPQFTFQEAKNEVAKNTDFLNGYEIQDTRYTNFKMYNSPNFFIKSSYILEVSNMSGVESYVIFDPINGNYKFLE